MKRNVLLDPDPAVTPAAGAPPAQPAVEPAAAAPPVNEPAAAAAPAPDPAAPPADSAATPPAEPPVETDPLMAAMLDYMKGEPDIKPVAEPDAPTEPAAPSLPSPAAPAAATPAPAPAPAAPAPRKARKTIVADALDEPQPVPVISQPAPAAAPPIPQVPPTDPDADYIAGLSEDQREELAEADVAARLFPEKYKNRRKQLLTWYRSLDSTVESLSKADPERSLDENDPEFNRFLATKPKLDAVAAKKVQRHIGAEQAVQEVKSEYEPKLLSIERKQQEIEFKPKAEELVNQVVDSAAHLTMADTSPMGAAVKTFKESGKWGDDQALEAEIYKSEMDRLKAVSQEYIYFAKGLRTFDPNNPAHAELTRFINEQGQSFAKAAPAELRVRNGRTFLPRQDYLQLARVNPAEAQKYWTFNHKDVLDLLAFNTQVSMSARLKFEEEQLAKRGFVRQKKATPAQTPKEPQPLNPPKAVPAPAKGGGKPAVQTPPSNEIDVVATLGLA